MSRRILVEILSKAFRMSRYTPTTIFPVSNALVTFSTSVKTKVLKVYEDERKKLLSDSSPETTAIHLPLFHDLQNQLYRQRAKLVPLNSKSAGDLILSGDWTLTETNEPFIPINDKVEEISILVLATTADFRVCESDMIHMDGRFKVCSKIFYQLYVIHSSSATGMLPELFCLLPDKKTATYHRLLSLLKAKADDMGLNFSPKAIMVDFELAVT